MTSFEFFRWLTLCFGTTYVITQSYIFGPFRMLLVGRSQFRRVWLYCSACTGFWVGVFYGLLFMWPQDYGADGWAIARECIESGIAAMTIGAIWSAYNGNPAFDAEQGPLLQHEHEGETDNQKDDEDGSA